MGTPPIVNTSSEKPVAHQSPTPNAKSATPPVGLFLLVRGLVARARGRALELNSLGEEIERSEASNSVARARAEVAGDGQGRPADRKSVV